MFPTREEATSLLPGKTLVSQVVTAQEDIINFLYGGHLVAEGIKYSLSFIGRPLETFRKVLDFGCGSARVIRWFESYAENAAFFGSDVNADAIEWCNQTMGFGKFITNQPMPPLPDELGKNFDLIYGISVVTHVDEAMQLAWLEEFKKRLAPNGILILTVHGEGIASDRLFDGDLEAYHRDGQLYKRFLQDTGLDGLPSFYQVAYHKRRYILQEWSKLFKVLAYIKHGPMYLQDTVILQNNGKDSSAYSFLDLPIGCIDSPKAADEVNRDELFVKGWCFHSDCGKVQVELWIDNERVGSARADLPTPSVGEAFPTFPSARQCGFNTTVNIGALSLGPHQLYAMPRTNLVPTFATYFFKRSARAASNDHDLRNL